MTHVTLPRLRALIALAFVLSVPALSTSCQSLANIEDRTLGECGEFCDTVMANCKDENLVYENRTKCMGVCKFFDVGDPNEPQGSNTLSCRMREAKLALNDGAENASTHCRSAGPEGLNCDGGCESYCQLYERACGVVQCGSNANCVAKCKALNNKPTFNLVEDYDGNTLQCRLVHLSNASVARGEHCKHAQLSTPNAHCLDGPDPDEGAGGAGATPTDPTRITKPECEDFCRVNGVACSDEYAMYESEGQCKALCAYFDQGEIADTFQNTLGCRLYHSYNSLCDPATHCSHTSPGGEGHCGNTPVDKCLSYCQLASRICPTAYASQFRDTTCADDCATLVDHEPTDSADAGTRYSVAYAATTGTLACRFLALSRAAQDGKDGALCGTLSAFGAGDCAP